MRKSLGREFGKKIVSMEIWDEEEEFEFLNLSEDEEDDNGDQGLSLSHWEVIDVSEIDSEGQTPEIVKDHNNDGSESGSESESTLKPPQEVSPLFLDLVFADHHRHRDDDDDGDDDDDDDQDEPFDPNDELVPWSVYDKLERQRTRKSGKRGFQKIHRQSPKKKSHLEKRPVGFRGKRDF